MKQEMTMEQGLIGQIAALKLEIVPISSKQEEPGAEVRDLRACFINNAKIHNYYS